MAIPVYGFLEGDTIGLLLLAEENETVQSLSEKLQRAARLRVKPFAPFKTLFKEQVLNPSSIVASCGLQPLDRFDVVSAEEEKD